MIDGKHLESEVEIMTADADTGHGNSPECAPTELDAAAAHTSRPTAEATTAPADTTVSGMPDADSPTQPAEGQGTTPHLPPGATVRYFGDYELQREIARGGMGVVFKARQVKLNRPVALKMILAGSLAGEAEIQRFYLEAEAAANLDHPGIVPIFEVGNHEGQHYFSMGFVEGQSLAQRVAEGPLPPREAAGLMVQIAEAVQYAHEKEVIHRDLKPGNVLLDAQGQPKVTDFGLAKKLRSDSALTASGQIMGTPSYMPPEQAEARAEIGPLADVYSLGAILFCLLTGRPPFQAANVMETLKQVLEQDPPAPRTLNAAIPLDLETITLKCLRKEPHRRYGSARELAEELNRFLADKPIRARQVSSTERCVRWARRNPVVAVMCGVLTALLVAVAVGSLLVASRFASLAGAERSARLESDRLASSESEARVEAQKAQMAESKEKQRAEEALREAQKAQMAESKEKQRAEEALRESLDQTYLAIRNEVRAIRLAHEPGWRRAALERIGGLVGLGSRKLDRADLRTEAIACLAELDVRLESNFAPDISRVWHLQFSPDGRTLAANDEQKSRIYLRDLTSDRELPSITKSVGLAPFVFHPGGAVAVPSAPGRVTFHALKPGQRTFPAIAGEGQALNLAFSQSGERLAIAWGDLNFGNPGAPTRLHRITVHETATGSTLRTIAAPPNTGVVYKLPLALSPDGNLVAVAGPDVSVRLYPVEGNGEPAILGTLDDRNCALAFRPDGRALAACGGSIVVLWDLPSRAQRLRIVNGKGLWGIAFSPDGRLLAAASNDATGRLWDSQSGRELAAVPTQTGGMGLSVAFSPQGDRFAVGAVSVSVLAIEGGRECRTETSQTNGTSDSVFDPIQPVLFSCGGDGKVYAWRLDQSVAEVNHVGSGGLCPSVIRLSPGGRELVLGVQPFINSPAGQDNSIQIWPRDDPTAERRLTGPKGGISAIAIDPIGRRVAAGSSDGGLYVWDLKVGTLLYRQELGASATTLNFLEESRLLVAAGKRLLLLAAEDGTVRHELTLPDVAQAFVVYPDGKEALVGTPDGVIHSVLLPDLRIERSRMILDRPDRLRMALSPDGSLLAATTQKGTRVVLLDPRTLERLAHLPAREGSPFNFLVFHPKGRYLAYGLEYPIVWDLALVRDKLDSLRLAWDQPAPTVAFTRDTIGNVERSRPQVSRIRPNSTDPPK